jgi:hypothetical protein
MTAPIRRLACAAFLCFAPAALADIPGGPAAGAATEPAMGTRMAMLVGSEHAALARLPREHLTRIALPDAGPRGGAAEIADPVDYSPAMLASVPPADGGAQWECLTQALYFEARGESVAGQFAVGEVILNRADHRAYPASVCGVVHQGASSGRCQFSFMCDGHAETVTEPDSWDRAGKIARLLLDGAPRSLTGGATYFHSIAVRPSWARVFTRTARIGAHIFYRDPNKVADG